MPVKLAALNCAGGSREEFVEVNANIRTGYVFIPNMPNKQDAWYLTSTEREHAYKRLGEPRHYTWDRTVFKRVLLSWQFWLLPFIFMRKLFILSSNNPC